MDVEDGSRVGGDSEMASLEPSPEFSWRAMQVLVALGVVALCGGLLIAVVGDRSVGQLVTAGAAIIGSLGALGLALALHVRRAWALPWARIALLIVAALGIAHTVIAVPTGTLWIPLDTLLAVWALLAGDHAPPRRTPIRPAAILLVALVVLAEAASPLGSAAAELSKPPPDPNAVIMVENRSPRAVIVLVGDLFATRTGSSFVAPCGGSVRIPIPTTDHQDDGRLMAMIAIDDSGQLDAWTATSPAPSEQYAGSYSMSPIWSRGDLAGRLPLRLVVHDNLAVDSSPQGSTSCVPNPSAWPTGS